MADNPFDRVIINPRELPLSEDINRAQSQLDYALRFLAKSLFGDIEGAPVSGFVGTSFQAIESNPAALSVDLRSGLGFQNDASDIETDIDGITALDDAESYKPLPLVANLTVPVSTAPSNPNTRIDIIEVRADRLKTNNLSRNIFDTVNEVFDPTLVDKTLEFALDGKLGSVQAPADSTAAISYKEGVEGAPGASPATTPGYLKICEIQVGSGVTEINQADITDFRNVLLVGGRQRTVPMNVVDAKSTAGSEPTIIIAFGQYSIPANADGGLRLDTSSLKPGDRVTGVTVEYNADINVAATGPYLLFVAAGAFASELDSDTSTNTTVDGSDRTITFDVDFVVPEEGCSATVAYIFGTAGGSTGTCEIYRAWATVE